MKMRANTKPGSRFTVSLVTGILLVPAAAAVEFLLVDRHASAVVLLDDVSTSTEATFVVAAPQDPSVVVEPVTASADDLAHACGEDGYGLVGLEPAETISNIHQAALATLRQLGGGHVHTNRSAAADSP